MAAKARITAPRLGLANQVVVPIYTELAAEIGLAESALLVQIDFWIQQGASDPAKHLRDGRLWTYQSVRGMAEKIKFLSKDQVDRAIKALEERGLIVIGNYNQRSGDRTRWLAIDHEACARLQSCQTDTDMGTENGKLSHIGTASEASQNTTVDSESVAQYDTSSQNTTPSSQNTTGCVAKHDDVTRDNLPEITPETTPYPLEGDPVRHDDGIGGDAPSMPLAPISIRDDAEMRMHRSAGKIEKPSHARSRDHQAAVGAGMAPDTRGWTDQAKARMRAVFLHGTDEHGNPVKGAGIGYPSRDGRRPIPSDVDQIFATIPFDTATANDLVRALMNYQDEMASEEKRPWVRLIPNWIRNDEWRRYIQKAVPAQPSPRSVSRTSESSGPGPTAELAQTSKLGQWDRVREA